jgi:hypothetical protein
MSITGRRIILIDTVDVIDSIFIYFVLGPYSFYLTTVGAVSYCCMGPHTRTDLHSVGLPWTSDRPVSDSSTCSKTRHSQGKNNHFPAGYFFVRASFCFFRSVEE